MSNLTMYAILESVNAMSLAEMLVHIDALYGRENIDDELDIEQVRAELVSQLKREFRVANAKVCPDENFWIKVIREQERMG